MVGPAYPVLIFDGDCALCSSCVRFVERRMRRHPACRPWQEVDLGTLGLTRQQCEAAVQFVGLDGSTSAGETAVAHLLVHAGSGWSIVGRVLLLPGVRSVAGVVYRWVARHRHRLPGGTPQCSLGADRRGLDGDPVTSGSTPGGAQ